MDTASGATPGRQAGQEPMGMENTAHRASWSERQSEHQAWCGTQINFHHSAAQNLDLASICRSHNLCSHMHPFPAPGQQYFQRLPCTWWYKQGQMSHSHTAACLAPEMSLGWDKGGRDTDVIQTINITKCSLQMSRQHTNHKYQHTGCLVVQSYPCLLNSTTLLLSGSSGGTYQILCNQHIETTSFSIT